MKNIEVRSFTPLETRADDQPGRFSGYIVTWGSVDTYNTTFKRGSFKKTLSERGSRIKLLWNHDFSAMPIGVVTEIREDDKGVYFEAQLSLLTEAGRNAHQLMLDGAIDTMSFGFRGIKSGFNTSGIKEYTEVALQEISPVNFEANETATIDQVRSQDDESRATSFSETIDKNELYSRGSRLRSALSQTIDDISWSMKKPAEVVSATELAIEEFKSAYVGWLNNLYNVEPGLRGAPDANDLSKAVQAMLGEQSVEEFTQSSRLTIEEIRSLRRGQVPAEVDPKLIACDEVRQLVANELTKAAAVDISPALPVKTKKAPELSLETRSLLQSQIESLKNL
ncbi:HK97 family phage prohead protease [Pseudomonas putida]